MASVTANGKVYEIDVPGLTVRMVGPAPDPVPIDPEPEQPPTPPQIIVVEGDGGGRTGAKAYIFTGAGSDPAALDLGDEDHKGIFTFWLLDFREGEVDPIPVTFPSAQNAGPFALIMLRPDGYFADGFSIGTVEGEVGNPILGYLMALRSFGQIMVPFVFPDGPPEGVPGWASAGDVGGITVDSDNFHDPDRIELVAGADDDLTLAPGYFVRTDLRVEMVGAVKTSDPGDPLPNPFALIVKNELKPLSENMTVRIPSVAQTDDGRFIPCVITVDPADDWDFESNTGGPAKMGYLCGSDLEEPNYIVSVVLTGWWRPKGP